MSCSAIVCIMQGCVADGDSTDPHRLQLGRRIQLPVRPTFTDPLEPGDGFGRGILVGHGPAGRIAHGAQSLLDGIVVDLDDQPVRFKV
jgi:hypothetical protein